MISGHMALLVIKRDDIRRISPVFVGDIYISV
jgi:hypothetical protein